MGGHRARPRHIVVVMSGLLLAVGACASTPRPVAPARSPTAAPPTAAALLARAAAAPLQDAAFTLTVFPGEPGSASGTGLLTTRPQRLETLIGSTFDTQWGRITDGTTYYEKAPVSPTWFPVTDTTTLLEHDSGAWLFFLDVLGYGHLHAATVRGAETLDGIATWHLRAQWDLPAPLLGEMQGGPASAAEDLWLDRTRFYPVRMDLHGGSGDAPLPIDDLSMRFTAWDDGQAVALPPAPGRSSLAVAIQPAPWACTYVTTSPCSPSPCPADTFPCGQLAGCSAGDGPNNFPSFILRNTGGSTLEWSGLIAPTTDHVTLVPTGGLLAPGATQTARLHGNDLASIGPGAFIVVLTAEGHTVLDTVQCHNG